MPPQLASLPDEAYWTASGRSDAILMPWVEGSEETKKRDFEIAFENAWKELIGQDYSEVARRTDTEFDESERVFRIKFMGDDYLVKPDSMEVIIAGGDFTNPFYAFLILHYLIGAKDVPLANEVMSFRELYGGDVYYLAFKNRAIEKIRREFESRPEELVKRGIEMGGEEAGMGDYSVRIPVFPKVPITIIMWLGDDEVPTSANMLFDKTAGEHLRTEDIAAIGENLARRLSS